ncbi:MAG: family 10 glycosylhydrolase, partial [Planctomycetes bacterium]|nr:family 10 glycosylhydrolase [Planctomycetota bacterium]
TPENRSRYGRGFIDKASRALERLGNKVETIEGAGISGLPEGAVLVLPDLYIIPADVAEELERFVRRGGRAIVFDGPVLSMNHEPLQRVLGFKATRSYFHAQVVLEPVGDSELVPAAEREIDVEAEKRRWADWLEYRKWGVTQLVRDVHERARQLKPRSLLTAAVFTPLASADAVCQDWPGWLEQGIIDLCIPMAYTESDAALEKQMAEWKTLDPGLARIVPGLSIYRKTGGGSVPRDAAAVLRQRQLCEDAGAHGNVFFSLHHLTPELTTALTRGPFSDVAPAYRPAEREAGSRAGR